MSNEISCWEGEGGACVTSATPPDGACEPRMSAPTEVQMVSDEISASDETIWPHPGEWDLLDEVRDQILSRAQRIEPLTPNPEPVAISYEMDGELGQWAYSKINNHYKILLEQEITDILGIKGVDITINRMYQADGPCSSYWLYYCRAKIFFNEN